MADFKIDLTADASSAVAGFTQTAQASEKTAQAIGKAADESARYQAALQKMAATQAAGQGKSVSAEDQGMMDRAAARRAELAERKKLAAAADKEIAAGVKTVTQAEVEAATEVVAAGEKAFASKQQLKGAVKGLKEEFPGLAHVAKMALNPIVLVVAGIGAAFAIWKARVDALVVSLGGVEMPDLSDDSVKRVGAMAKAYEDFAEALRKTVEAYNSVDSASKRDDERIDAEEKRHKKLLESQKNLALARLEAAKASMKPGEYERAKAGIEDTFESMGVKDDEATKLKKLRLKADKEDALRRDAKAKQAEAAKIKVGSAEEDAKIEEGFKKERDWAVGHKNELMDKQADIRTILSQGLLEAHPLLAGKMYLEYGATSNADLERQYGMNERQIGSANSAISRYDRWMREKDARERARKRRDELMGAAAAETGEAGTIHRDMWDKGGELDQFDEEGRNQASVDRNNRLARANKALGAINDQAAEVDKQVTASEEGGNKVLNSVIEKLKDLKAAKDDAARRLDALESARKMHPPST